MCETLTSNLMGVNQATQQNEQSSVDLIAYVNSFVLAL